MRIVSLLPALTELVCTLGRRDDLVGVTHECDYPAHVCTLPRLTRSSIPADATSAEIDALVASGRGGLYTLDEERLAALEPDLILTQAQCDVCAVNEGRVRRCAERLPGSPRVESFAPTTLDEVFAMYRRVGELLDRSRQAEAQVSDFERSEQWIRKDHWSRRPRPSVLLLEWLDPPFSCGHWNPEIVSKAGGDELFGKPGQASRRLTWKEISSAAPEVVIVALCGFSIERAEQELREIGHLPEWQGLPAVRNGRVAVADGSSFFSRPGPRLEVSLRITAGALHPLIYGGVDSRQGDAWRFFSQTTVEAE